MKSNHSVPPLFELGQPQTETAGLSSSSTGMTTTFDISLRESETEGFFERSNRIIIIIIIIIIICSVNLLSLFSFLFFCFCFLVSPSTLACSLVDDNNSGAHRFIGRAEGPCCACGSLYFWPGRMILGVAIRHRPGERWVVILTLFISPVAGL